MTAHKVTAPLVIVNKPDGSHQYLYEGALIPDYVPDDRVKDLMDSGLIDKITAAEAKLAPAPAAESN